MELNKLEANVVLYATLRNSSGLCIASIIWCAVFMVKATFGMLYHASRSEFLFLTLLGSSKMTSFFFLVMGM